MPRINPENRQCAETSDVGYIIKKWPEFMKDGKGQLSLLQILFQEKQAHQDCATKLKATWADIDAGLAHVEKVNNDH